MKALISIPDRDRRPSPFIKAAFASAQAGVNHRRLDTFLAKDDVVSRAILDRAAIAPGTTTGSGFAAELVETAYGSFLASLAPYSAAARIIAGAMPSTLDAAGTVKYPTRAAGPSAPQWVAESGAIPVNIAEFSLVQVGPKRKIASIIPWTMELSKRSDAQAVFETLVREDVAAGLDAAMLSTAAGSSSAYAGLLNGLTAGAGFAGGDREAIETDLATLGETVATNGSGSVLYIMAPQRLARLRIRAPELVNNLDIAASAAVPATRIIAVEPGAIISAVDPMPDLEFSNQASLHMSDAPLEIVSSTGPTTADPVRSLWQTASMALRIIHEMAWAKRRTGAVAYLDGATW